MAEETGPMAKPMLNANALNTKVVFFMYSGSRYTINNESINGV
ncbi:serine endoprotease [Yersinia kristensenii ATCC 33638]|nr:serine endoprotease [Yersinia kristensenii ATCC 33638]